MRRMDTYYTPSYFVHIHSLTRSLRRWREAGAWHTHEMRAPQGICRSTQYTVHVSNYTIQQNTLFNCWWVFFENYLKHIRPFVCKIFCIWFVSPLLVSHRLSFSPSLCGHILGSWLTLFRYENLHGTMHQTHARIIKHRPNTFQNILQHAHHCPLPASVMVRSPFMTQTHSHTHTNCWVFFFPFV